MKSCKFYEDGYCYEEYGNIVDCCYDDQSQCKFYEKNDNDYNEDRDIISSDDECSRCTYQVNCCGQCCGNYDGGTK